jgi:hypothetical protein
MRDRDEYPRATWRHEDGSEVVFIPVPFTRTFYWPWVTELRARPPMRCVACSREWWRDDPGEETPGCLMIVAARSNKADCVIGAFCRECYADKERVRFTVTAIGLAVCADTAAEFIPALRKKIKDKGRHDFVSVYFDTGPPPGWPTRRDCRPPTWRSVSFGGL